MGPSTIPVARGSGGERSTSRLGFCKLFFDFRTQTEGLKVRTWGAPLKSWAFGLECKLEGMFPSRLYQASAYRYPEKVTQV